MTSASQRRALTLHTSVVAVRSAFAMISDVRPFKHSVSKNGVFKNGVVIRIRIR